MRIYRAKDFALTGKPQAQTPQGTDLSGINRVGQSFTQQAIAESKERAREAGAQAQLGSDGKLVKRNGTFFGLSTDADREFEKSASFVYERQEKQRLGQAMVDTQRDNQNDPKAWREAYDLKRAEIFENIDGGSLAAIELWESDKAFQVENGIRDQAVQLERLNQQDAFLLDASDLIDRAAIEVERTGEVSESSSISLIAFRKRGEAMGMLESDIKELEQQFDHKVLVSKTIRNFRLIKSGQGFTKSGRPLIQNEDGSVSSEVTITVTHPSINDGKPTNIPSIYNGEFVSEQEAVEIVASAGGVDPDTGRKLPGFESIKEAETAARSRSSSIETVESTTDFLNSLMDPDGPFGDLPVDQRQQVQAEVIRYARGEDLKDAEKSKRLNSILRDQITSASVTGQYDRSFLKEIDDTDELIAAQTELDAAVQGYNTVESVKFLSLPDAQAQLELLRPEPGEEDFADKHSRYTQAVRAFAEGRTALQSDPAAYISQAYPDLPVGAVIGIQQQAGVQPRVLGNQQAKSLVNQFAGVVANDALGMLNSTLSEYQEGEERNTVYRDLIRAGLPAETQYTSWFNHNPVAQADLVNALAIPVKQQIAEIKARPSGNEDFVTINLGVRENLIGFRHSLLGGPTGVTANDVRKEQFRQLEMAVQRMAYHYVADKGMAPDVGATQAAEAFTSRYEFVDSVRDFYRVPAGSNVDRISAGADFLRNMIRDAEVLALDPNDPRLSEDLPESVRLDFDKEQERYRGLIRNKGQWVTNKEETGLVLVDEFGNEVLVRDDDGSINRYEFGWQELGDRGLPIVKTKEEQRQDAADAVKRQNRKAQSSDFLFPNRR